MEQAMWVWLIVGLVGGVLGMLAALRTFPSDAMQWVTALVAGLIGGWLGGWLFSLMGLEPATNWLGAIIVSFLGAWLILLALRRTAGTRTPRT